MDLSKGPLGKLVTTALLVECVIALITAGCIAYAASKAFWTSTLHTSRKVAEVVSTDVAPAVVEWAEKHKPGPEPLSSLRPAAAVPGRPFQDAGTEERLAVKRLEIAIDAARVDLERSSAEDAPARRARLDSLEALRARYAPAGHP